MNYELDINKKYEQIKINILAPELTDDISKITTYIDQLSHTLTLLKNNEYRKIDIQQIIYIENIDRMTFFYTYSAIYEDKRPLYELEKKLKQFNFIRINKQTLISPQHIQSVNVLFNSRFELLMVSGDKLIVTRHYRKTFKSLFEKGGIYNA